MNKLKYLMPFIICFLPLIPFSLFAGDSNLANTLIVFGEAEKSVQANEWEMRFEISLKEKSRDKLTQAYNISKKNAYKLFSDNNIKDTELKTQNLTISPWYEWEKNSNVLKGYMLSQSLSFTSQDIDLLGKIISKISLINGVTISSVNHNLSFEKRQEELKKLYKDAFVNAQSKINAILEASKKKFKKTATISEDLSENSSLPRGGDMAANVMMAGKRESEPLNFSLVPLEIKLSAKLRIVTEIE